MPRLLLITFALVAVMLLGVSICWSLAEHGEVDATMLQRILLCGMAAAMLWLIFQIGQLIGGILKALGHG